jgi:hypothetical protein
MVMRQEPKLRMRTDLRDHVVVGHVRGVVARLVHRDVVEFLEILHDCFFCYFPNLLSHTIIRFVSVSAKFGICAVVGLIGTFVDAKIRTSYCNVSNAYLASHL